MNDDTADLRELLDRQRIWECMLRYARGMDRLDRKLALSAYHPGAIDVTAFDDRAGMTDLPGTLGRPTRDRDDPSYLRPLPLTREPGGQPQS